MGFTRKEPIGESRDYCEKKADGSWYYAYKREFNCVYGHKKPLEKRIICVLADGEHGFDSIVFESFARYAARCNVSLHIMREFTDVNFLIHWEKFRIKHWLDQGYRVMYLDHDTYVTKACPNLFDLVPPDYFAIVDQNRHFWYSETGEERVFAEEVGNLLGKPLSKDYNIGTRPIWQAGMFIAGPQHAKLFELPANKAHRKALEDWPLSDQSYLNYKLFYHKVKVLSLPRVANNCKPLPGEVPWIVHAAGIANCERSKYLAAWDGQ